MKRTLRWGKKMDETLLNDLEGRLGNILKPVSPPDRYIRELHRRLVNFPEPVIVDAPRRMKKSLIWALTGLFSVALLLSIGIKTVISLLKVKGRTHRDSPGRKHISSRPIPEV